MLFSLATRSWVSFAYGSDRTLLLFAKNRRKSLIIRIYHALLENLSPARRIGGEARTLDRAAIEKRLLNILNTRGEDGVNVVRDTARTISAHLGLQKECLELAAIIGALLATRDNAALRSPFALSHAMGEPYDTSPIALFDKLVRAWKNHAFPLRAERTATAQAFANMAFFESYLSNFIEGTIFAVNDAQGIISRKERIPNRAGDSHDVKGTYAICSDRDAMSLRPVDAKAMLETLMRRHATLVGGRPEMDPGRFKVGPNRAGSRWFVDPSQVIGTLIHGYERIDLLTDPSARALNVMFIVSETHPFHDGNGRIARLMMNAELVAGECSKLIIPTCTVGTTCWRCANSPSSKILGRTSE